MSHFPLSGVTPIILLFLVFMTAFSFVAAQYTELECSDSFGIWDSTVRAIDWTSGFSLDAYWNREACTAFTVTFTLFRYYTGRTVADCSVTENDNGSPNIRCIGRAGVPFDSDLYFAYIIVNGIRPEWPNQPQIQVIFPDAARCGQSLTLPYIIDFPVASPGPFVVDMRHDTTGWCALDDYAQLILSNSAREYSCDPAYLGSSSGVTQVTCQRERSTMSTATEWTLRSSESVRKRAEGNEITIPSAQPLYVTHNDAPEYTGGLRRRNRQSRFGITIVTNADQYQSVGQLACEIPGRKGSWECIEGNDRLDACGGCPGESGTDCTELLHVRDVMCIKGACKVTSCMRGFSVAADGIGCVSL